MLKQNFTQYAIANGYPSDYDVLDHGDLGASGHVSGRQREAAQGRQAERAKDNKTAHIKYAEDILAGKVIDPSGEITQAGLKTAQRKREEAVIKGERWQLMGQISFIESLGKMSHRENGTLKLSYQRTVDLYQAEIEAL